MIEEGTYEDDLGCPYPVGDMVDGKPYPDARPTIATRMLVPAVMIGPIADRTKDTKDRVARPRPPRFPFSCSFRVLPQG
jgi:hypothetical protein